MTLVAIINALFWVFYILLFANIVLSWVRISPYHPVSYTHLSKIGIL